MEFDEIASVRNTHTPSQNNMYISGINSICRVSLLKVDRSINGAIPE